MNGEHSQQPEALFTAADQSHCWHRDDCNSISSPPTQTWRCCYCNSRATLSQTQPEGHGHYSPKDGWTKLPNMGCKR